MAQQSPFNGTPTGYADSINGSGIALSGVDCGGAVTIGAKCFVAAAGGTYWTLHLSNAVVDHATVETARNFPAARWLIDGTPGTGTVTSVGSADGSVVITNATTTPDLSVRVVSAANPVALAAINTNTVGSILKTGSTALVTAMRAGSGPGFYVLQAAISTAPDGFFIIATADDASRQWVHSSIQDQGFITVTTVEIDFTVSPQTIHILPPMNYRLSTVTPLAWAVTAKDGTVTTGPTMNSGTDSPAFVNFNTSALQTTFPGAAVNSRALMSGATTTQSWQDLTTSGYVAQITNPVTLGTATTMKARGIMCGFLSRN
jgi:hypothetical protein